MNISLSPQITLQKSNDGALLLNKKGETHYELDEVGMRLWQLLAQDGDFDAALAQILDEYPEAAEDEDALREELLELLEDMAQADLVAWE